MPYLKNWDFSNQDLVTLYLKSLCSLNGSLSLNEKSKVIYNGNSSPNKVVVVSGGGSGHEPTHAGFVGQGMLDVAVAGNIFASPSAKQILGGIKSIGSENGYLLIVKNYTGDILHFGLAAERAKALGLKVELVIVADDVAVGKTKNGLVGRRGLAGTVLVHKIAGALSSTCGVLSQVAATAQKVVDNLVTIAASLEHCSVPGRVEEELDILKQNEIEIGMGIHNEPGVKKYSSIPKIDDLVTELLGYLLSEEDEERDYVSFGAEDEVVLLINNLGGTSSLELNAIATLVIQKLASLYTISPVRIYIGEFTSSLNGQGFSITLLNATKAGGKDILDLLDAPTDAVGWVSNVSTYTGNSKSKIEDTNNVDEELINVKSTVTLNPGTFESVLRGGLEKLLTKEQQITRYDTVAGDGDCGETLAAGAHALLNALDQADIDLFNIVNALNKIATLVEENMGGTSGGIYSIFISALSQSYLNANQVKGAFEVNLDNLAESLKFALTSLFKYTRARSGDRTLVDVLEPFVDELNSTRDLLLAKTAAVKGAEKTRKLKAKFGRASYVSEEEFKEFESEGGLPDPGAVGLAALIEGFVDSFYKSE